MRIIQNSISTFKPAWWLKNRHLQTIFPVFFRRKMKISLLREKFTLSDDDDLIVDWTENRFENKNILVLLHGLEGSSNSPYIKGMMQKAVHHGFRAVCMHFRSCENFSQKKPLKKAYHAGETQDLDEFLKKLFLETPQNICIFIVGYSLGGNVLLKWLGETGYEPRIKAAIAVSVPFDLAQASIQLNHGFSKFYQWKLLRSLKKMMWEKFENHSILSNQKNLDKIQSLFEFDDKITAPMHGFLNAKDYYLKSSSLQYWKKIKNQTLIIHAADDPFFLPIKMPQVSEMSACLQLEISPEGGHVGFIEGNVPFFPKFYLERRVMDYFLSFVR
jgi:uncharacterized protein